MADRARNGEIAKKFDNNGEKSKIRRMIMEKRVSNSAVDDNVAVCKGLVIGTAEAERIIARHDDDLVSVGKFVVKRPSEVEILRLICGSSTHFKSSVTRYFKRLVLILTLYLL